MSEVIQIASDLDRPQWTIRRTLVIAVLLFCAAEIVYLTGWGKDDELRATIANGIILMMGMVVSTYVLGVVWSDMSFMKASNGRAEMMSAGYGYPGGMDYGYDPRTGASDGEVKGGAG